MKCKRCGLKYHMSILILLGNYCEFCHRELFEQAILVQSLKEQAREAQHKKGLEAKE